MENRIIQLSVAPSSGRQTPKDEFGAVLSRGLSSGAGVVTSIASAFTPGGAVLSAAINQTARTALAGAASQALEGAGAQGAAGGVAGGGGSGSAGLASAGGATPVQGSDSFADQRQLMLENQQWTQQYLALQDQMQQESREYTALTNIMKVRHESAKTAINNIR